MINKVLSAVKDMKLSSCDEPQSRHSFLGENKTTTTTTTTTTTKQASTSKERD